MRLSSFLVTTVLLVSVALFAQHGAGGGGSHSGGSASSTSMASSHSFTSSSSHSTSSASAPKSFAKGSGAQQAKSSHSLLHPFRKSKPEQAAVFTPTWTCVRRPCPICPTGQARNGKGACAPVTNACLAAYGFSCGGQYWSNDCNALAGQLASQQRFITNSDPSETLIYQTLLAQYEQCVNRYRFGAYGLGFLAFDEGNLFALP